MHIFYIVRECKEMTRKIEDPDSAGQPPDTNRRTKIAEVHA